MQRFQLAERGPLPTWVRIWGALTVPAFLVLGYLAVFVELTSRQELIVFGVWAVVAGVPAVEWMWRIHVQEKSAAK